MTKQTSLGIIAIIGALFLGVLSLGQGAQARHHGYGVVDVPVHIHAPHHGNWDTVGHVQHGDTWAHGESHLNWGSDNGGSSDSGSDSGGSDSGGDSGGSDGGDSGDGGGGDDSG